MRPSTSSGYSLWLLPLPAKGPEIEGATGIPHSNVRVTVSLRDSSCLAVALPALARSHADSAYLRALRGIPFLYY